MFELEVKTNRYLRILAEQFTNTNSNTYTYRGSYKDCVRMQKKLARKGISGTVYRKEYNRSYNYRTKFFEHTGNKRVYRCVYCGRKILKKDTTVDHVIPVERAKKYRFARWLLTEKGCAGVNDVRNLVASCHNCNRKKGSSLNVIYLIRAKYGSHLSYWILVWGIRILLILGIGYFGYMIYTDNEFLTSIIVQIEELWQKMSVYLQQQ